LAFEKLPVKKSVRFCSLFDRLRERKRGARIDPVISPHRRLLDSAAAAAVFVIRQRVCGILER
jgi:hypothetical protein